jgi:5'(3')-deoxyribonucleotidase
MTLQSTKLRIALDLDGVLADTIQSVCTILNKRRSTTLTREAFDRWNAWEIAHITRGEFLRTLDEAWFSWKEIPPVETDLGKKVNRLTKFGTIDIVTGRSEETVPLAQKWLEFHRIPYERFVRTVSTSAKADLDYDLFIDDSDFLMSLIASRLVGFGFLYPQPWNRSAKDMPRIFKVKDWDDVSQLTATIRG